VGAVLIAGTLILLFPMSPWLGSSSREEARVRTSSPSAPHEGGSKAGETAASPRHAEDPSPAPRSAATTGSPASTDARFRGRGEIRGHVEVSGTGPFPEHWRLVLRPSTSLVGRDLAEERVLEFAGGVQDFVAGDLPLAGYDVIAEAEGMNGLPLPILLDRRNASPFVNLRLTPAGSLEGRVVDAEKLPAEGVTLTLVPLPEGELLVARTDALGDYRFPQVLDGSYLLFLGTRDFPLVAEPTRIAFRAPTLTVPELELPSLATLELTLVDEVENRLEGVRVAGSSPHGGTLEGITDATGRLVLRHLLAGRWRIQLDHEGHKSRRVTVELATGETERVSLQLFP